MINITIHDVPVNVMLELPTDLKEREILLTGHPRPCYFLYTELTLGDVQLTLFSPFYTDKFINADNPESKMILIPFNVAPWLVEMFINDITPRAEDDGIVSEYHRAILDGVKAPPVKWKADIVKEFSAFVYRKLSATAQHNPDSPDEKGTLKSGEVTSKSEEVLKSYFGANQKSGEVTLK